MPPFTPGPTVTLAATATSGRVAIPLNAGSVRLANPGASVVFVRFGDGTVAATTSDMPILPGTAEAFSVGGVSHVAGICSAGQSSDLAVTGGGGQ